MINTPAEIAGFIGISIVQVFGGSLILLAIAIVFVTAYLMWQFRATMQETYLVVFLEMAFLRLFMNDSSFNDVGVFGMLHNLLLIGSALVWAKLLTSSPGR